MERQRAVVETIDDRRLTPQKKRRSWVDSLTRILIWAILLGGVLFVVWAYVDSYVR